MMATSPADTELLEPPKVQSRVARPQPRHDRFSAEDDIPSMAPRGIVIAMLVSLPFWALLAFTAYLLL